tara:strand:+ start:1056 stop:1226 length:171 start_codon:yes stop_codon:yes gene_type:complete
MVKKPSLRASVEGKAIIMKAFNVGEHECALLPFYLLIENFTHLVHERTFMYLVYGK